MSNKFKQDIQAMYVLAEQCDTLAALLPTLSDVLRQNESDLADVTYAYRLATTDTDYLFTFALNKGRFAELTTSDIVDVTVSGAEKHLLAIFQRKLNPMTAMLTGRVSVTGSKTALMKLASFL